MFPALPTGSAWTAGAAPRASTISQAAVCWPAMRSGFTEFTSTASPPAVKARTTSRAASKEPSTPTTRAPWRMAWASFPRATLPAGEHHHAGQAGPGGVGGRRGRGVAGGGTGHRLGPGLQGFRHGHRHPPVLERPGRVGPVVLQEDRAPHPGGETGRRQQGSAPLVEGDDRGGVAHRQAVAVGGDQAAGGAHSASPSTRMVAATSSTSSRWLRAAAAARWRPSRAS